MLGDEFNHQDPLKLKPEPLGVFVGNAIKDGFQLYFHQPYVILVAAFLSLIPIWIVPLENIEKMNPLLDNFKWEQWSIFFWDFFIYSTLSLAITWIAHAIVWVWSYQASFEKTWNFAHVFKGLAKVPRVILGYGISFAALLFIILLLSPLLLLTLLSQKMIIWYLFGILFGVMFFIIRWQPKFEYFIVGLAITDEPIHILWNEWRHLPHWIWLRFLSLLIFQVLFIFLLFLFTAPFLLIENAVIAESLQGLILSIGLYIGVAITGIAFVRSRDEWAEITNVEEKKSPPKDQFNESEWIN
ncbi:MAG: hypothetical protein N2450_00030 [bacterium]|nr:hypothetical protein [bacterium]